MASVTKWLDGLHAIVVGPGLGRDKALWDDISAFIQAVKQKQLPLVIDGVLLLSSLSFYFLTHTSRMGST